MTHPRLRRHRSRDGRQPVFDSGPGDDGLSITEALAAVRPEWDGATFGLPVPAPPGLDTQPLGRLRAQPRYSPPGPDMFPALRDAPPPPAPHGRQDPRDTGPQQRLPRMTRVRERARPQRDPDCAIFTWSALLGQHIMLCGTCPPQRRNRYADPIAGHMPFAFESLRVSAHVSGWRLDAFARWACPACQMTAAYHPAGPVVHSHPEIRRRKLAGEDVSPFAEAAAVAIREHDLIRDVAAAAAHGRHRARAS